MGAGGFACGSDALPPCFWGLTFSSWPKEFNYTGFVKVVKKFTDLLLMNTISPVSLGSFSVAEMSLNYQVAVAKKLQDVVTLEGQAALALIEGTPVSAEPSGVTLNEKV